MKEVENEPGRGTPRLILLLGGVLLGVIAASFVVKDGGPGVLVPPQMASPAMEEFKLGQQLSLERCGSCHLYPEPAVLDKVNWGLEVLPDMGSWLGIRDYPYEQLDLDPRVREANIIPKDPQMSLEEWRAICAYYLAAAPSQVAPPENRPPMTIGLKHFEVIIPEKEAGTNEPSLTTMVKIDPVNRLIYTGSATNNLLAVLDASARQLHSINLDSPPVAIEPRREGFLLTLIGSYLPSDKLQGQLVFLPAPGQPEATSRVLLKDLPRPVDSVFADLNGDGRQDILVCGYGNNLGELAWYETHTSGELKKHVIEERPGAIKAHVHDFNQDGKPDIVAMYAQAREGIYLYLNKGDGLFAAGLPIAEKHPAWGYSHLELVDYNGDGWMDLLACNGDNGDHTGHLPPFKPYHGIRLYANDGKNGFTETWFQPLNGAYKTITRDFDLDGDLDIAAISFYVDYRRYPREGFVYLENKGNWQFEVSSFDESLRGRWLAMDAGDLDGDGDLDIVLGSFVDGPTAVPGALHEKWRELTPPVFILKNTVRR
jgi:hypothetical protein